MSNHQIARIVFLSFHDMPPTFTVVGSGSRKSPQAESSWIVCRDDKGQEFDVIPPYGFSRGEGVLVQLGFEGGRLTSIFSTHSNPGMKTYVRPSDKRPFGFFSSLLYMVDGEGRAVLREVDGSAIR